MRRSACKARSGPFRNPKKCAKPETRTKIGDHAFRFFGKRLNNAWCAESCAVRACFRAKAPALGIFRDTLLAIQALHLARVVESSGADAKNSSYPNSTDIGRLSC